MTIIRKELDKRIKDFSDVQSFIQYDSKYIGKKGYFTDNLCEFQDLDLCEELTLCGIDDNGGDCIFRSENGDYYRFFLPESLLKEVKYRPLTKDEFIRMFNNGIFGQWITMKSIITKSEYYMQVTGCHTSELGITYICLGSIDFSLATLFKDFQWKDSDGNWRVFGVEV